MSVPSRPKSSSDIKPVAIHDAQEEAARDLLIQEPVAILREDSRRPVRVVHVHADEPAEQQDVIQLLHQQALAANRIEDLKQLARAADAQAESRIGPRARRVRRTRATCRAPPRRPTRGLRAA